MADRNRGEKSTVRIARSSLRAKWLRAAPDTTGARLRWRDPDGVPIAQWRRQKKLEGGKKFQDPAANFFRLKSRWLTRPFRLTPAPAGVRPAAAHVRFPNGRPRYGRASRAPQLRPGSPQPASHAHARPCPPPPGLWRSLSRAVRGPFPGRLPRAGARPLGAS